MIDGVKNAARYCLSLDLHFGQSSYTIGFAPLLNWLKTEYKCFRLIGTDGALLMLRLGPLVFTVTCEKTPPHWRSILEPVEIPGPEPRRALSTNG